MKLSYWVFFMLVSMVFIPISSSTTASSNVPNSGIKSDQENQQRDSKLQFENLNLELNETQSATRLYSNPEFIFFDNKTGFVSLGLPSFWKDQFQACESGFRCTANFTTGWKDNNSFQISTSNNTNGTFSNTYGQEIEVKPTEHYQIVTHMKLNDWATQSHITIEGFNQTNTKWYQIEQCPSGHNGPLDWREFSCVITIPMSTTKIRPILHSGWSSQENKEAVTTFDAFYMIKLTEFIADPNLKT